MRAHRTISTTATVVALAFLALLGTGSATSTAAPAGATYKVQRGDTLGSIAAKGGTTIAAVVSANGLKNPNLIRVGQVLALPGAATAPAAAAARPATRTPAGGATFHVVKAGDTISRIAAHYAIPQAQLIDANGLTGGRVYVGQRLRLLPSAAAPTPISASGTAHTVVAGQTLSDIAKRYGTTIKAIQDANGITDPNLVVVGRVLKIPAGPPTTGGIVCPIRGAMHHMNDWGFPRSGGRFHEGNDLFAARGTPAVATVAGTVVQTLGLIGGKQVKLMGVDGSTYYYTHLDGFGAAGRVAAAQVIGYVGTSGNAVGGPSHVHFEVHPGGGAAVNPYPLVAAAC
jgi:LysM repeat protein